MDTLIAITVLVGGIILLYSSVVQTTPTAQATLTAQDLLTRLSDVRINESGDPTIIAARFNGTIASSDNYRSVLEEIVYLYYLSNTGTAAQIINSSAASLVPSVYNAQFSINSTVLYTRTVTSNTQQQSAFVLKDRRIIIGLTNTSQRFGPYVVELAIWQ